MKWIILLTTHPKSGKSAIECVSAANGKIQKGFNWSKPIYKSTTTNILKFDSFEKAKKYSENNISKYDKYTITIAPDFDLPNAKRERKKVVTAWKNIFKLNCKDSP